MAGVRLRLKKSAWFSALPTATDSQQATISLMRFGAVPSYEDFKRLCELRVDAEKKSASDIFVDPAAPTTSPEESGYGAFYSGGEKSAGRMFSCYLSIAKKELVTIYVEGIGVPSTDHLASFRSFYTGLKRK
jgi:hypothetical protein